MRCGTCQTELGPDAKFCSECGAAQPTRCKACGELATKPGQRFCSECGAALLPQGIAPVPQGIERRLVSVLFADLVEFTAYTEKQDAEDVRATLSQYFSAARRIVGAYGGTVSKFIGDAVMAVWGAPVAREDDAERTVRAALDLVAAVTGLGDRLGLELRLRAGVLTGEAAVELHAVGEGMVVGDAVNTASRIQSLASPGEVLVDEVTRWITERAIVYQDAGRHAVKGKSEPLGVWRAVRVVGGLGGAGRDLVESPLVGRQAELATLRGALDALLAPDAKLQLVSVVGQAGLGKSRLAWELQKYADGLAATVLWHRGQARSFGEGAGFAALADMVRMRAEITQDETPEAQERKLGLLLASLFEAQPEAERVRLALRRLLGLDDGRQEIERGELFSAWRLLFERLAAQHPVVLVFEDLHWADRGLFDFIEHLTEWAPAARVLALAFSRPDERLDAVAMHGVRIDLLPLEGEQIEELVGATVAGAPAELLGNVREHASGVPLFAVESLRMLANRGAMVAEEQTGRYRLTATVKMLEVPASIHALIAARLDGLGELERRMLMDGAVLGQQFDGGAAASLAGIGERDARSLLDGLVAKQLLAVNTDPRSPQRGRYAFVHRQVQRVALSTIAKRERRRLHLAAAEQLRTEGTDADGAALLAGHLLAAAEADASAPDAAEIRRRALSTTLAAAERAEGVGALEQAAGLYDRAAEIECDDQVRARVIERAARCLDRIDPDGVRAAERYAKAGASYRRAGRERDALYMRAQELAAYRYARPASELLASLEETYQALRGKPDRAFAFAADMLAYILTLAGDGPRAETIAREAVDAARTLGDHEALCRALDSLGTALDLTGRPLDALEQYRLAAALGDQHVPSRIGLAYTNLGYMLNKLGPLHEAPVALTRAIKAAERTSDRIHRSHALLQLARTQLQDGHWDQALEITGGTVEPTDTMIGAALGPLVLIAIHRGECDRASAALDVFAGRLQETRAAPAEEYRCLREAALAHLLGEPERAANTLIHADSSDWAESILWLALAVTELLRSPGTELAEQALAALRARAPSSYPAVAAQSERLAGQVALRNGDLIGALEHGRLGERIAGEAGLVFDAAVIALELAEASPDEGDAEALRAQALGTFTPLGAVPWVERASRQP